MTKKQATLFLILIVLFLASAFQAFALSDSDCKKLCESECRNTEECQTSAYYASGNQCQCFNEGIKSVDWSKVIIPIAVLILICLAIILTPFDKIHFSYASKLLLLGAFAVLFGLGMLFIPYLESMSVSVYSARNVCSLLTDGVTGALFLAYPGAADVLQECSTIGLLFYSSIIIMAVGCCVFVIGFVNQSKNQVGK